MEPGPLALELRVLATGHPHQGSAKNDSSKYKHVAGVLVSCLGCKQLSSCHFVLAGRKLDKLKNQTILLRSIRDEVTGQTAVPRIGARKLNTENDNFSEQTPTNSDFHRNQYHIKKI